MDGVKVAKPLDDAALPKLPASKTGVDPPVFRTTGLSSAGCASTHTGVTGRAVSNSEQDLDFKTKRKGVDENLHRSSTFTENGKQVCALRARTSPQSSPMDVEQEPHQRAGKKPKILDSFDDDKNGVDAKMGFDLASCTSDGQVETCNSFGLHEKVLNKLDKLRMARQKACKYGKRRDRKQVRASMKIKFDSSISKAAFGVSDSATGGKSIFGIYGLKSDLNNAIKPVDDISLNKLLDGTCENNLCQDKGKKATDGNENILLSLRNACSVLSCQKAVESHNVIGMQSYCNGKMPAILQSSISGSTDKTNHDDNKYRSKADLAPSGKDSHTGAYKTLSDSQVYEPKYILERLALPPAEDLETLLSDSSLPTLSSHCATDINSPKQMSNSATLPPFPWSLPFGGSCKSSSDTGKLSTNRSTWRSKWVRIESDSSFIRNAQSCFTGLEFMPCDNTGNPSRIQDDYYNTCSNENFPEAFKIPSHGPLDISCRETCFAKIHTNDERILDNHSSESHLKPESIESVSFQAMELDGCLSNHGGDELNSVVPSPNNSMIQGIVDGGLEKSNNKSQCPWIPTMLENSKPAGHSPRALVAASILCEMMSSSSHIGKRDWNNEMIKKPSHKSIHDCKPKPSIGKSDEGSLMSLKPGDPVKSKGQMSSPAQRPPVSLKKKNYNTYVDRPLARWSFPADDRFPSKAERSYAVNSKPLDSGSVRIMGQTSIMGNAGKGNENQHKSRKAMAMITDVRPVAHSKEWNRGKNKKER
ncbi:hypothetical protein QJS10_CPA01g02265 [Acorus calamus]|uniref:Uncharacterized protein n=1 Tax=Acorus calamus TaxID=4465 RepID=A0AAV9FKZ4_ACOCL|nr:hypothetical protein QJS10_CPA01g02265 [Acorus calamus]